MRPGKQVWNEAYDTALKRGLDQLSATKHASQVALSYADRLTGIDRHDDEKADRKLWGNGR